ncbi:5'-3' exoribonuclease 2-like [Pipistrellus kuhlii]|uniref:5'-3' exoribonuclease 2-like n=1 Tax=Pipistrellus kuhlii TaxID=59472 RepID=UPI001E2722FE|nr:5'-3' exoribonuclease 2-like [Pipistrellus kuhlii]
MRSPGLKSRVMFGEGRRGGSGTEAQPRGAAAGTAGGPPGTGAAGGWSLGESQRACRGCGRRGCGGGPAATARVHAGHLRHQLPQRRLNGSEWQPPPPPLLPLPPRCAAPARLPLGAR